MMPRTADAVADHEPLRERSVIMAVLTPLSIDLPNTGLPGSRELVAFKDVVMAHGARRLFGPLSFEVRGPQRIAIRGVNGSGKTTLLRLITGHLKPTAGDISRPTDRIAVLHLDLTSIEVLETALSGFDGALIAGITDKDFL